MRWKAATKEWIAPTDKAWLVDQRGVLRGSRMVFPARPPQIPAGWVLTDKEPPKSPSKRAVFVDGDWVFPEARAIIDEATGDVINVVAALPGKGLDLPSGQVESSDPAAIRGAKRLGDGSFQPPAPKASPTAAGKLAQSLGVSEADLRDLIKELAAP